MLHQPPCDDVADVCRCLFRVLKGVTRAMCGNDTHAHEYADCMIALP